MQPRDKISKASWLQIESSKDTVSANLTAAVASGQLKVEASQMPALLLLIGSSIDEGYHKSHRNFMKSVDSALNDEAMPAFPAKKK